MIASKDREKLNGLVQGRIKYNMGGFCSNRYFERLPGYIDVDVLSMDNCVTLLDKEYAYATPVCLCKTADHFQISLYQSLLDERSRVQQK
jgi:hypothetical protein